MFDSKTAVELLYRTNEFGETIVISVDFNRNYRIATFAEGHYRGEIYLSKEEVFKTIVSTLILDKSQWA